MNTKKVLIVIIVIALLAVAGFLFFIYRQSISKQENNDQEQVVALQSITIEDKKITDTKKPFNIAITYPYFQGLDDLNKKINGIITAELDSFKKNALENDKAAQETDPEGYLNYPRQYDLNISYKKGQVDENVISMVFSVYNFTGGAHGMGDFVSLNYDVKNNKEIMLADLFAGQKNYLQKISDYAKADINKQLVARMGNAQGAWLDDGAGPKEENFSVFMINSDYLTFYFPPYQVAAYAVGDFEVKMPR